ncbi:TetR/AcrR family transcriptional regulator [Thalassospira aquimaris]|uniref:TetR/AcrR family transcriptional regulator n=1 Tax=Thalassospira aquimaris TaxID=3037796 RepID=A0ABT6GDW5_9PROT|nr:TetR/AcrR family transcriptional regulator [Thalassospira sp. FZY0004]MDG4720180.1 TetR/AcrR family transcriptional regulator [Thalassospira sp. FZY0004]
MSKEPFSISAALSRITRADDHAYDDTLEVDESMEVGPHSGGALVPKRVRDPDLTRQKLLDAAFGEVRRAGFGGASIANILDISGCTKGALYHHFSGKAKLVNAVIDECLPGYIDAVWLDELEEVHDILPVMMGQVDRLGRDDAPELLEGGCPLARLASGAGELDEGLRKRIDGVYRYWRRGLASQISRAQFNKTVRTDVESSAVAEFVIASLHGFLTRPPALRSRETQDAFAGEFARYLNNLRP